METTMRMEKEDTRMQAQITIGEPIGLGHGKIDGGTLSAESANELAEQVTEHLVSVDKMAPSTCIDGRPCGECMDGSPTEARPSVAGGGLLTAYAAAELTGWFEDDNLSTTGRLRNVGEYLGALQFKFGAHCDEGSVEKNFTAVADDGSSHPKIGCGADDLLVEILQQPYEHSDEVTALTAAVLSDGYDERYMHFVNDSEVAQHIADWNPTDLIDVLGAETANNIEILKGAHAEVAVVFNFLPDTTVDRDAFVADTGEQVFVVDMWYINKLAKAMARGPEMVAQEQQLKHAMVAYQVATYLTLCNGSQRPIFLK
ncbi:MAG: hypothetical protein QFB87_03580 [Patescibacteria group bacterium]|nr:hypothetical protein [Patescibacteria group bacterium]